MNFAFLSQANLVHLEGRQPIRYDVLSINVGISPSGQGVPGSLEFSTPVKPVSKYALHPWLLVCSKSFSKRICSRRLSRPKPCRGSSLLEVGICFSNRSTKGSKQVAPSIPAQAYWPALQSSLSLQPRLSVPVTLCVVLMRAWPILQGQSSSTLLPSWEQWACAVLCSGSKRSRSAIKLQPSCWRSVLTKHFS